MSTVGIFLLFYVFHTGFMFTKAPADYDLYGNKIALNDRFLVSADNLFLVWYTELIPHSDTSSCVVSYNLTSCDSVYSVIVPVSNNYSFVYNCIDLQGNNVVGLFVSNGTCNFELSDEQVIANYSTQDNFLIDMDGQGTGVYGFADDFVFFYELYPTIQLIVWPNTLNISPRGMDISANTEYAVVVGYCQSTPIAAVECGFLLRLNTSLSCPVSVSTFDIATILHYPWSDPRALRYIPQSRTYIPQSVMSVSIAWQTRQVLIGIQSLNTVLLYALNNTHTPISTRQNGVGLMGFGKSVAWLDQTGHKAAILANTYLYTSYQWVSSSVHIYDIQSDGFSDSTQPIFAHPNSEQPLQRAMDPSFIRITCSPGGNLGLMDRFGNGIGIISAPPETYTNTDTPIYITSVAPCIRGTGRNYSGVELCYPYSSLSYNCSTDTFCPYGAVGEVSYSAFEAIDQDQDYPEPPENTVFDDLLMQNVFMFNLKSVHCFVVSPISWVLLVMIICSSVAILMAISERFCPHHHSIRDRVKQVFMKMDLIGEGELWIGGLTSAAIIVLVVSAYYFSSAYLYQYPIERVTHNSTFACDVTLRNAKFSTTTQKRPDSSRSTKEIDSMFQLLNTQVFTLNIDLVQTAFTCNDSFYVQRLNGNRITRLAITKCEMHYNETILSLAVLLPVQVISVQLILPGLKTIGAIRIGISGPSAQLDDGKFTLLELNFASAFFPSLPDQVLAESTVFPIGFTQVINRTDPLEDHGWPIFGGIWSSSFSVNSDELFTNVSRYTFFYRTQTNISIQLSQSIFYISNLQQPIARQTEVIFRGLLFTIVVLEVFGLLFLLIKLLFIPVLRIISSRPWQRFLLKRQVTPVETIVTEVKKNENRSTNNQTIFVKSKFSHRQSTDISEAQFIA